MLYAEDARPRTGLSQRFARDVGCVLFHDGRGQQSNIDLFCAAQ